VETNATPPVRNEEPPAGKSREGAILATNRPPKSAVAVITNEPAVPVEVVEVGTEPQLKSATDLAPATNEMTVAAARVEEKPLIVPRRDREQERSGFLDRATRWFRPEEKKAPPRASPAPSASQAVETPPLLTKSIPPQFARYAYNKTSPPKGNRTEAEKHFVQGARAHQEQRLAAAIDAYRQAVAADPGYFDAQYNLGLAAFQMRDLPLALAANEAASRLRPESADARYHFAMSLRDANYPVDAAQELRELLAETPGEARAHLALANLYAQLLDEPALAQRHYRSVLELAPNHPDAAAIRQWLAARR
jgi:tetratricopeptide (TPR) repeat protein